MKGIPHLHDLFEPLPADVREAVHTASTVRKVQAGASVYCRGDEALEMYQVLDGCIRLCNYSLDGKEFELCRFRAGDCFGEMALIDGLTRASYAFAAEDTALRVLAREHFHRLYQRHPEISRQLNLLLSHRVRMLFGLSEEIVALTLRQRLARQLYRLAYSQGERDAAGGFSINVCHDELSRNLAASRQSVSKELKALERDGDILLRYGRIDIDDLGRLQAKYEGLMGGEQLTAIYPE